MSTLTSMPAASSHWLEAVRVPAPYANSAVARALSAPKSAAHGTTVPAAGFNAAVTAAANAATRTDVQGSPPREAPV
jgi:hypothetical protein